MVGFKTEERLRTMALSYALTVSPSTRIASVFKSSLLKGELSAAIDRSTQSHSHTLTGCVWQAIASSRSTR